MKRFRETGGGLSLDIPGGWAYLKPRIVSAILVGGLVTEGRFLPVSEALVPAGAFAFCIIDRE